MRASRTFRVVASLLVFALGLELNRYLERASPPVPAFHSIYLPSGKYLGYATLGNGALVADLLYIWSIQYYSTDRIDRWRHLPRLYEVITDLDPRFITAYSIGALILALEASDREAALRLLDKGIAANPASWELPFDAGFTARESGDTALTGHYFRIAAEKPGAPSFVRSWYRFTLDKLGRKEDALALWEQALAAAKSDYERQVAARYVHDLRLEIELEALRGAIARFESRSGRFPFALEELVRQGELGALPRDPDGNEFIYDRRTGEVKSSSSFLLYNRIGR